MWRDPKTLQPQALTADQLDEVEWLVETGGIIPSDGEIVEGIASVDGKGLAKALRKGESNVMVRYADKVGVAGAFAVAYAKGSTTARAPRSSTQVANASWCASCST